MLNKAARKSLLLTAAAAFLIGCSAQEPEQQTVGTTDSQHATTAEDGDMTDSTHTDQSYVLQHTVEMIDGEQQSLEAYKGKVVLMVNVASACGYTRQYEGLEALYRQHKDEGLVVIGFPANDFGAQEPGTNDEIAAFCSSKFDVTFPMAGKISVKGDGAHPLYKQISSQPAPIGGEPGWNFTKFLVDRNGRVVDRFDTKIELDDPALLAAVSARLADD